MNERSLRWAKLIALVLLVGGVLDLICRCVLLGSVNAFTLAFHDPAKTLFHLMQLPLAAFVLLRDYPITIVKRGLHTTRPIGMVIGVALLVLAVAFSAQDTIQGFTERWPMPEDFASSEQRRDLVGLRLRFLELKNRSQEERQRQAKQLYNAYASNIGAGDPRQLSQASFRVFLSGLLTAFGVVFAVFLLWTLIVHAVSRQALTPSFLSAMVFSIGVLSPWLLLRPYSEWHLHFGEGGIFESYAPLGLAIFFSILVIVLTAVLRTHRRMGSYLAICLSGLTTVLAVTSAVKPGWFSFVFWVAAPSDLLYMTIFYFLAGCFVLALLAFSSGSPESAEPDVVD
jgi:hypothetical protein